MGKRPKPEAAPAPNTMRELPATRAYQAEMLEESKHRNIIIALDTGSGKTLIAVQRILHELEREPTKISWFFAPTVALCEQQRAYIDKYVPASVGLVSGANEPDQWKDAALWQRVLATHRVMVSTPQVFLDALRHGYISLGRDISLLVFDEAHHALDNHPYNRIMLEFYFNLPVRTKDNERESVRPVVLGLTASPIYGGNVEKAFRTIETNLDSTIRSPRQHRAELAAHVHRPVFRHITYPPSSGAFSTNLAALQSLISNLNIEEDPYTISLRAQLKRHRAGTPEHTRADQRLSKVLATQGTFTHKGLVQFARAAEEICSDVGAWAADWFVATVIARVKDATEDKFGNVLMLSWRETEKRYLARLIKGVVLSPVSYAEEDVEADVSPKAARLIECLLQEKFDVEDRPEDGEGDNVFSCITFVQRRDTVLALAALLTHHPATKHCFRIGTLLGTSDSSQRHALMDITRALLLEPHEETLDAFRAGEKNLIISTSVAEEGLDVQACGSVVRWDPPPNMASWAQSRGRARRKRSTFTVMFEEGGNGEQDLRKWEEQERRMVELYNDPSRDFVPGDEDDEDGDDADMGEDDDLSFTVESTGATLTLHSAISHLTHFCAVIPNSSHVDNRPIYDVDPPEFPPGWHALALSPPDPHPGPFGARLTLPRTLPLPTRVFSVPRIYKSKISAFRHIAYNVYLELWEAGLLNDHLLAITSLVEPEREEEVREMLKEVERREGMMRLGGGVGGGVLDPWAPPPSPLRAQLDAVEMEEEDVALDDADEDDPEEGETWYCSELHISGQPPLLLFARTPLLSELEEEGPVLYRPVAPSPSTSSTSTSQGGGDIDLPAAPPTVETIHTSLTYLGPLSSNGGTIHRARMYTRTLFSGLNGSRMREWDDPTAMDFAYLLLPADRMDDVWERRRSWWEVELCASLPLPDDVEDDVGEWVAPTVPEIPAHRRMGVPARVFGEAFRYPSDIALVQKHVGFGKPFKFVRWRGADEPLSEEEEAELREAYKTGGGRRKREDGELEELEIRYPLLEVQAFPPRTNFLVPPPPPKDRKWEKKKKDDTAMDTNADSKYATTNTRPDGKRVYTLIPEFSTIILLSPAETDHAFLLPSILRALSMSLTTHSMRRTLFRSPSAPRFPALDDSQPMSTPPPATDDEMPTLAAITIPLLQTAITAPASGERTNYQRMETLGDTVLKFVAGVQLLAEYPLWHEGYLTRKKDHAVSNVRLAKENIKRGLYRWVIRDNMLGKKWKPRYFPLETTPLDLTISSSPDASKQTSSTSTNAVSESELVKEVSSLSISEANKRVNTADTDIVLPLQSMNLNSQEIDEVRMDIAEEKEVVAMVVQETATDSPTADAPTPEKPAEKKAKGKRKKTKKNNNELSTKLLADVVESTVGAAYLYGGFDMGYECLKYFDLGLKWQPLGQRIQQILARVDASMPGPDEPPLQFPRQLEDVERMIGYTFKRKILLIEAFTHASYQNDTRTPSYERMEFLGDSVLDMIITDFLYHAPGKNYSPGHMHLRKSAVVNAHILAYICMKTSTTVSTAMPRPAGERRRIEVIEEEQSIHLWQCLLHSSPIVLEDQHNTVRRFKKHCGEIEKKLATSRMFPWGSLTRLQAPKFLSDMVESLIGAIYLDSEGSIATVRNVIDGLGIMPLIARIVEDDVDVLHPVSRLAMWASKHEKEIEYTITKAKGRVSCAVVVDGKEEAVVEEQWRGKASEEEVKYAAAEAAIEMFHLRHSGSNWESLKKKKIPRTRKK